MLSISPISANTVNFKSQSQESVSTPRYELKKFETEATSYKKWGVGIASWVLPGLGQAINGEWGKGFAFFGLSGILPSVIGVLSGFGVMMSGWKNERTATMSAALGLTGVILTAIGGRIWSCVDAVRNAKSETFIPVQKS